MARILVVEDDEILRNGIAFALTREGYQVKTAGSLSGMRGQLEGAPDLVILDINLPDGDGFSLTAGIFCPACGRKARCLLFFSRRGIRKRI